jgi:tetratricopeptide (TPR) repeat protein
MAEPTLPQRARLHVAVARGLDWVWPHGAAWAYADALRWAPQEPELHFRRGGALGRAGRWPESARAFASAARLRPKSLEYQGSLVVALDRAGRIEELFVALRRLCGLRPDEGELSVLLGAVLLRHGRRAEAIKVFRWAVRLSPGHERRRFVLGEALLGPEGWVQALDSWQGARQLNPDSVTPAEPVEGRSVLHLHPGRRRERPSRKPAPSWGTRLVARLLVPWAGLGAVVRRTVVHPVAGDERQRRVRSLRRAWHKTHPRATRWPVVLLSLRRRAPDASA